MEAALAWETLEELDASLSHMVDSRKTKQKTDMARVAQDIETFRRENPTYKPPKLEDVAVDLSKVEAYKEECDFEEMISVD